MSTSRRGGVDNVILISGGAGDPEVLAGTADPTAGGGVAAPEGSLYLRYAAGSGALYVKTGAADTAWNSLEAIQAYGSIYVSGGSITQTTNATPGDFDVVTAFNTSDGANGLASGTTPVKTSNKITLDTAGVYAIDLACAFVGDSTSGGVTFTVKAYVEGVVQDQIAFQRKTASTDVGSAVAYGLISVNAGDDLDLRVAADAASSSFTPVEMNLTVMRVGP